MAAQTADPFATAADAARLYDPAYIEYLRTLRFTGTVYALPEGTVIGPQVPILRVTAPRIQATIVEAALLATINQATAIATKASRIARAANGKPVWDGSLRRLFGAPAGVPTARAAYIGGLAGTATVRAGYQLGIPTTGTMAHAWVQKFGEPAEQQAFETWLTHSPQRAVLLVDTYNTRRGVERAIAASQATGVPIKAIRIDSGDLADLTRWARTRLDAAGMGETRIMVSGDLDEYEIARLEAAQVPADLFLVGTRLGAPGPVGDVYKLTRQNGFDDANHFVMKRAPGKQTDPGDHQVFNVEPGHQTIALTDELLPGGRALMRRVMTMGQVVGDVAQPTLQDMRDAVAAQLDELPAAVKALDAPTPIRVTRTRRLWELRANLGDAEAAAHIQDMAQAAPGATHTAVDEPEPADTTNLDQPREAAAQGA